jgi:hypothetical protein
VKIMNIKIQLSGTLSTFDHNLEQKINYFSLERRCFIGVGKINVFSQESKLHRNIFFKVINWRQQK